MSESTADDPKPWLFKPGHKQRTPEVVAKWKEAQRRGECGFQPGNTATPNLTKRLDFFEVIDCAEKAYVLGLLAADGCIDRTTFRLFLKDHELVDRAHGMLDTRVVIKSTRYGTRGFVVGSRRMVADLARHGVVPRKSLTHEWPTTVPPEWLWVYVLGYFDGDGSINIVRTHKGGPKNYPMAQVCCSWSFAEGFRAFLVDQGIHSTAHGSGNLKKDIIARVQIVGQHCARFGDRMYEGHDLGLERKRARFRSVSGQLCLPGIS